MATRVSDWRIPLTYIGSVFLFACGGMFVGGLLTSGDEAIEVASLFLKALEFGVFQVLGGSVLFGAMFMATDPVTSPFTKVGKWIYGTLCGLLTILIRVYSGYVEGVMFSIVIMNATAPLIDHLVLSMKYREVRT